MRLSPLKSIRKYCVWCVARQSKEVRLCPKNGIQSDKCPLYDFRFGHGRGRKLKMIKMRCKDCSSSCKDIKNCSFDGTKSEKCPLYDFRSGKNINRRVTPPWLRNR